MYFNKKQLIKDRIRRQRSARSGDIKNFPNLTNSLSRGSKEQRQSVEGGENIATMENKQFCLRVFGHTR